jgi:hypothetical protein
MEVLEAALMELSVNRLTGTFPAVAETKTAVSTG